MVRRGNDAFKTAAIHALHEIAQAGDVERAYQRWFLSTPEPGGVNLGLPVGEDLRR